MENYDEDLTENPFFQVLQTDHSDLFRRATLEGWIICVPRAGSVPKYALSHEDFFGHILIPNDELPESHFRTLNDKEVRILNRVITLEQQDIDRPYVTHILFEETFYTEELRYKVFCIESPLEKQLSVALGQSDSSDFVAINTLRDSIDLLWTESAGHGVLEKIDHCVKVFLLCNEGIEFETLGVQKDLVGKLYTQCLQLALSDSRLRDRTSADKHLLENVKLSVETYMHHGVYKTLFQGVTACTAYEDAQLNKTIRNLCDIQLRDLGIRPDLYSAVPWAKQELARIDCYSTVLGKIGCLKRMLSSISQQNDGRSKDVSVANAISADDLLPMIVFLVMKTALPNWVAHLTYMKQFHFSASATTGVDENSFLITSLEAAIEHIKSGVLLGPSDPEGHSELSEVPFDALVSGSSKAETLNGSFSETGISHFFDQVRLGNVDYVREILEKKGKNEKAVSNPSPLLCHPLCSCDKCESMLSEHLCDTTPTINSCDDRGFTALHVASLFGQYEMVDLLISHGSNVDATDYSSSTPLHYAAAKGHQNALLMLLHAGCMPDVSDSDSNTPLHFASNNGHEGCVKALLYYVEHVGVNLDVNCANSYGDTPLHHASRWGYEGIVQILLDYGALPNVENKRHLTPVDYAHSLHISRTLMKSMKKNEESLALTSVSQETVSVSGGSRTGDDYCETSAKQSQSLDFSDDENSSSSTTRRGSHIGFRPHSADQMKLVEKMLRAIAHGDIRLACFYMGLEGPVDKEVSILNDCKSYCHPLCTCEKCQPEVESPEVIRQPQRKTLNVNACNSEGFTPLHVASMHGHVELVRLLLDAGAHTNVCTRSKQCTPLHLASQNQRLNVVKLLLQTNDCDVNLQDFRGNTPLHYACYTGNAKLVKMLMKCVPQLNIRNVNGKTALQEAEENMSITVVELLKRNSELSSSASKENIFL